MIDHAQSTLPSTSAPDCAAAVRPLELLEARMLRDTLKALLGTEQSAMADFLVALADFDRRRGWEPLGHANLFAFLRSDLGLSRSGTYWRLSAARLVQRFPEVVEPLRDGRLCMSTTAELAKVLTAENRSEVMPRYYGLSAREAQEVTAELAPRPAPPVRALVTRQEPKRLPLQLPQPAARPEPGLAPTPTTPSAPTGESVQTFGLLPPPPVRSGPTPSRDDVEPLTADLRRLHMTVSRQLLKKLETAQAGLGHAVPGATREQVIDAALDLLLEKQARARGQVKRPRTFPRTPTPTPTPTPTQTPTQTPTPAPAEAAIPSSGEVKAQLGRGLNASVAQPEGRAIRRTGHREAIPASVKRAVWARDGGRCSWPLDGGGRCGSTHRLELDHLVPWGLWGGATEENLRLVCRAHNRVAARQAFGERVAGRDSRGPRGAT